MRYWIWWNDLIQGPFELDEITSLKAFSGDLLVCMEDRQEWIPASRVADLSPVVEQLRARSAAPSIPPPPPPKRSPSVTPLQGEFFGDPPGQQSLIEPDDGPKGPFAYRPATGESDTLASSYFEGRATMPFHFVHQPMTTTATVVEIPRPKPERITMAPPPVIRESPVRKPEEEEQPIPLHVIETAPIAAEPSVARDTSPSLAPSFEELPWDERKPQWLPWIMGVVVVLAALGSVSYWAMDRASTHSAISEANRITPAVSTEKRGLRTEEFPAGQSKLSPESSALVTGVKSAVSKAFDNAMSQSRRVVHALKLKFLALFSPHQTSVGNNPAVLPMDSTPGEGAAAANRAAASHATTSPVHAKVIQYTASKSKKAAVAAKKKVTALHHPARTSPMPVAAVPAPAVLASPVASVAAGTMPEVHLPGVAAPAVPVTQSSVAEPPAASRIPNPWKGKQSDAIALAQNKKLPRSKTMVGDQARTMLQEMHEKELIHAAETGERLYLPDKMAWAALEEDGPLYRVYLNFLAMQANGERVQSRSYLFVVDLKKKEVRTDDPATRQDLLTQPAELAFKHNPMATDIDSILGGVDTYNKHKVQLIIVKKNNRNREDRKKIEAALAASKGKVMRAVLYFRKTYTEKALQNIANAYQFTELLKGQ